MNLSLGQTLSQSQNLTGGLTTSVFTKSETMLVEDHLDYQRALKFVARRKDMSRYDSVMDFLFCETFTKYRRDCFRYYDKKGPPLRDMATDEQIRHWDNVLVAVLQEAVLALDVERKVSWGWVVYKAKARVA